MLNFQTMKRKNQEEVENRGRTTSTSISWFFYSSGSCIYLVVDRFLIQFLMVEVSIPHFLFFFLMNRARAPVDSLINYQSFGRWSSLNFSIHCLSQMWNGKETRPKDYHLLIKDWTVKPSDAMYISFTGSLGLSEKEKERDRWQLPKDKEMVHIWYQDLPFIN